MYLKYKKSSAMLIGDLRGWRSLPMKYFFTQKFVYFFCRSCKSITSQLWFVCASQATRRMCWRVLVLKFATLLTKTGPSHRLTSSTSGSRCWSKSESLDWVLECDGMLMIPMLFADTARILTTASPFTAWPALVERQSWLHLHWSNWGWSTKAPLNW